MIPFLIPFKYVGDFKINSKISNYFNLYEFEIFPKDGEYDSEKYNIYNPSISLFVENEIIESICCDEECLYKERNLIGMSIDEFISHTGEKYYGEIDEADFEEDNIPQYIYEFEDIGLQVWTKNDIVVTVIASTAYEDD
jgi:hypothetical protein